ncbi:MAG: hypothetical protein ACREO1_15090 [Arenimonas sp.]
MTEIVSCLGAFALELSPQTRAGTVCLQQAQAGELAALLARDLAKWVPEVSDCDFTVLAALFDPVEILRPGFPLHAELERLTAQAPGQGQARIIALGANDKDLPDTLAPAKEYADGPFRLVPFLLRGDAELIQRVGEQLESSLLDIGMAPADTALFAQESFKAQIEHARYLTVHDLAAMMAMQYEHAGLQNVWPLIETALLAPNEQAWCDAMPEPLALYRDGEIHMTLMDADDWQTLGYCGDELDPDRCEFLYEQFEMRQRQMAALFQAHGLEVTFEHCTKGRNPKQVLLPG